jgi:uncharacterized protein (TIGR03085 family)
VTRFAQIERQALCDLFLEVGPSAPTLCEGWVTSDLAAHLVLRERRPDAVPGVIVPALAGYTEKIQRQTRDRQTWEDLVAQVRSGPPLPLRPIDEVVNSVEFFVHHEDVRRAGSRWEPRQLSAEQDDILWTRLRQVGRVLARRAPTGLTVHAPGHGASWLKRAEPTVTVQGSPGELILLAYGRAGHARISYDGDELSVERLRHAHFGL